MPPKGLPFKCGTPGCGRSFERREQLIQHNKDSHSKLKPKSPPSKSKTTTFPPSGSFSASVSSTLVSISPPLSRPDTAVEQEDEDEDEDDWDEIVPSIGSKWHREGTTLASNIEQHPSSISRHSPSSKKPRLTTTILPPGSDPPWSLEGFSSTYTPLPHNVPDKEDQLRRTQETFWSVPSRGEGGAGRQDTSVTGENVNPSSNNWIDYRQGNRGDGRVDHKKEDFALQANPFSDPPMSFTDHKDYEVSGNSVQQEVKMRSPRRT
ncbi:hypothetical protein DFH06DRAFT_111069 [Mycena polygramma]|nr:hypothetical protein DFH06DRAFT_111069 [Mycena polygramma]